MDTPHGRVELVQAFAITAGELEGLKGKTMACEPLLEEHRRRNPLLITDLDRA